MIKVLEILPPRLTAAQKAGIDTVIARYRAVAESTEASDRATTERLIEVLYAEAGLPRPAILWYDDPIGMTFEAVSDTASGDSIADILDQPMIDDGSRFSTTRIYRAVHARVQPKVGPLDGFSHVTLGSGVRRWRRGSGILTQLRGLVDDHGPFALPQDRTRYKLLWTHVMSTTAKLAIAHLVFGQEVSVTTKCMMQLVLSCGPILPHESVCRVSERPLAIKRDADGLLHCDDGPAVVYRSQLVFYYWHGVSVLEHLLVPAATITLAMIEKEPLPLYQRILIERMGAERFAREGAAERVSEDETGTLWRKRIREHVWSAVEVVNGTPEPDGSYRHYWLQVPANVTTARQAVAWTYGLRARDYVVAVRT